MNETVTVRKGEELDVKRLEEYLRLRLPTPFDRIEIEQYPAGSSNLTYLLRLGERRFVLRRPPFGNTVKTAHDMKREYWVLKRLSKLYPLAPEPFLFCDDESVIGAEFYLMERRRGLIIRGAVPHELSASKDRQERVVRSFIENLVRLHSIDHQVAYLGDLGNPEGYSRRQVEGWTKRYLDVKTHEHTELENVYRWLNERIPAECGAAIVHNDYKFDNIMLAPDDPSRIVAVLDWEMVTIGDPLMDLGTTLGYWMSPEFGEEMMDMPFNPRVLMENFTRRDLVQMYAEASGRDLPDMLFYYVFGTFKIGVIAQQIYARYVKGHTKDPRFANFDRFVAALGKIAAGAVKRNDI